MTKNYWHENGKRETERNYKDIVANYHEQLPPHPDQPYVFGPFNRPLMAPPLNRETTP